MADKPGVKKNRPNKLTQMINPKTDGNEHLFKELENNDGDPMIGRRIIEVNNVPTFEVRSFDPYALWEIVATRGTLPKELKGKFTTQIGAHKAIEAYLNTIYRN